jgi:hypothetical protein
MHKKVGSFYTYPGVRISKQYWSGGSGSFPEGGRGYCIRDRPGGFVPHLHQIVPYAFRRGQVAGRRGSWRVRSG